MTDADLSLWLESEAPAKHSNLDLAGLSDMDFAIAQDRCDVVEALYRRGLCAQAPGLNIAVCRCNVDLVLWLQAAPRNVPVDADTLWLAVGAAACADRGKATALLEAVRAAVDLTDTRPMDRALALQHTPSMEWLVAAGLRASPAALYDAVAARDLDRLQWLHGLGTRGDAAALFHAAVGAGDVRLVQQLQSMGYGIGALPVGGAQALMCTAVQGAHADLVGWLAAQGVPGHEGLLRMAIENGSVEVVRGGGGGSAGAGGCVAVGIKRMEGGTEGGRERWSWQWNIAFIWCKSYAAFKGPRSRNRLQQTERSAVQSPCCRA